MKRIAFLFFYFVFVFAFTKKQKTKLEKLENFSILFLIFESRSIVFLQMKIKNFVLRFSTLEGALRIQLSLFSNFWEKVYSVRFFSKQNYWNWLKNNSLGKLQIPKIFEKKNDKQNFVGRFLLVVSGKKKRHAL